MRDGVTVAQPAYGGQTGVRPSRPQPPGEGLWRSHGGDMLGYTQSLPDSASARVEAPVGGSDTNGAG